MIMQGGWQMLHGQKRFLPKYPNEEVVRFVFARLKHSLDPKVSRVLDLGCGGGRHTLLLAREGFRTYGADFSRSGLQCTASRLAEENLSSILVQADMHQLPFHDDSFDALIAFGSVYYTDWQGMQQVVAEIHRILRKGGKALVVTRTQSDCRFGKGLQLDSNSFLFEDNDTNECGMKNCFLAKDEVLMLFGEFSDVSLDRSDFTMNNGEIVNSDWIITANK
ncbi:MAG: class I SAM-dependent methyltransferase [Desulfobulbaceae bacterium]|nr:class I SAM-dependent methyltransferase [Desulfobulbaceae bacterium]